MRTIWDDLHDEGLIDLAKIDGPDWEAEMRRYFALVRKPAGAKECRTDPKRHLSKLAQAVKVYLSWKLDRPHDPAEDMPPPPAAASYLPSSLLALLNDMEAPEAQDAALLPWRSLRLRLLDRTIEGKHVKGWLVRGRALAVRDPSLAVISDAPFREPPPPKEEGKNEEGKNPGGGFKPNGNDGE